MVAVAGSLLIIFIAAAVLAPLIAPHNPNAVDLLHAEAGPSWNHLLGTDAEGRDLFSRLLFGARTSLAGPAIVVVATTFLGTLLAMISAWYGGWVDDVVSRMLDLLFALPGLLLAIVAAAVFGPSLVTCASALTISYIPYLARLGRGSALRTRSQPYIAAYELLGFSGRRICLPHILPAVSPYIIGQAAIAFGYATIDLAALSFLGLAVQPPTADWGVMVSSGETTLLSGSPDEALFAGLLIVLTVVSVNILGAWLGANAEDRL